METVVINGNELQVLAATEWVEEKGALTSRIVLLRWPAGGKTYHHYSTHIQMQMLDGDGSDSFAHGTYHRSVIGAADAFRERQKKYGWPIDEEVF